MKNKKVIIYRFDSKHLGKAFLRELLQLGYEIEDGWGFDGAVGVKKPESLQVHKGLITVHNHKCSHIENYYILESQWKEALDFAKAQIEPEFKEGEWVVHPEKGTLRIKEIENGAYRWDERSSTLIDSLNGNKIKKASPKQIEYALIKEAERRGYEGKQIKIIRGGHKGELSGKTMTGNYKYIEGKLIDYTPLAEYTLFDGENWAEIVENTKFFDWDVEYEGQLVKIAPDCEDGFSHTKSTFKELLRSLTHLDSDLTIQELKDELKKLKL